MAEALAQSGVRLATRPPATPTALRRRHPEPSQSSLATGITIGPRAICIYISFFIGLSRTLSKNIKNVLEVTGRQFEMEQIELIFFLIVLLFCFHFQTPFSFFPPLSLSGLRDPFMKMHGGGRLRPVVYLY